MPKNETKLQKEINLPLDSRVLSRESEYPKFIENVNQMKSVDRTMGAEGKTKFRTPYREENNIETNLGMKYVKVNAFDSKSSGNF